MDFRHHYNCCKTFSCSNLGKPQSDDYRYDSYQLGYHALYCDRCASHPPWVDDATVRRLLKSKLHQHFASELAGCPHCAPRLLIDPPTPAHRYGKTSAGHQRYVCHHCKKVYTQTHRKPDQRLLGIVEGLVAGVPPMETMAKLSMAPKIYYQLLQRIASEFKLFSRQKEAANLAKPFTAVLTESQVFDFAGNKRIWCLGSGDASSGYIYLTNHNLSTEELPEAGRYYSHQQSQLDDFEQLGILDALRHRYQQTMQRPHFEDLNYGAASALRGGELAQPALLAYAHFQMLRAFTQKSAHFHHYLEHESSIRGAALMACTEEIQHQQAEVFYVFRHRQQANELPLDGHNVGWWNDRWYPSHFGSYCPITYRREYRHRFEVKAPMGVQHYFSLLQRTLPKQLKSATPLDALFEILRTYYNYCTPSNGSSPATKAGLAEGTLSLVELLEQVRCQVNHSNDR